MRGNIPSDLLYYSSRPVNQGHTHEAECECGHDHSHEDHEQGEETSVE